MSTKPTLKDLDKLIKRLNKCDNKMLGGWEEKIWAHFVVDLPDDQFTALCKSNVTVIGGVDQLKVIEERMKKLGINT